MITALLLAAAPVPTVIQAERNFAADAHKIGLWTAFRKHAASDAVMFTPQAVWVQNEIKDRKDPPSAFDWWPTHSWSACDRRTAVNFGDAALPDGKPLSHFLTVWQRHGRGWHWVLDTGKPVGAEGITAKTVKPVVKRASCSGKPFGAPIAAPRPLTDKQARNTPEDSGRGQSADRTLGWDWKVDKDNSRTLRVFLWNGRGYDLVVNEHIVPRKK